MRFFLLASLTALSLTLIANPAEAQRCRVGSVGVCRDCVFSVPCASATCPGGVCTFPAGVMSAFCAPAVGEYCCTSTMDCPDSFLIGEGSRVRYSCESGACVAATSVDAGRADAMLDVGARDTGLEVSTDLGTDLGVDAGGPDVLLREVTCFRAAESGCFFCGVVPPDAGPCVMPRPTCTGNEVCARAGGVDTCVPARRRCCPTASCALPPVCARVGDCTRDRCDLICTFGDAGASNEPFDSGQSDATVDAAMDLGADTQSDLGGDAAPDAISDAPRDAPRDAGVLSDTLPMDSAPADVMPLREIRGAGGCECSTGATARTGAWPAGLFAALAALVARPRRRSRRS